ncbi:MAG: NAD(P)/FAD-dependent oxidoreductase [Pirellulales bacterium]
MSDPSAEVLIVGGGVAGLSIAMLAGRAGLPVRLLEAERTGFGASTRNQGWLHSGAAFADSAPQTAAHCRDALERTLRFCPECVEPDTTDALYIFSHADSDAGPWLRALRDLHIVAGEVTPNEAVQRIPILADSPIQHAFALPDRAIMPERLLEKMRDEAERHGARIETGAAVREVLLDNGRRVRGVRLGTGEAVAAQVVVLACGAGERLVPESGEPWQVQDSAVEIVHLKNYLVGLKPALGRGLICVMDEERLNHVPHPPWSIVGIEHWTATGDGRHEATNEQALARLWERFERFFPKVDRTRYELESWAGVTVQAMLPEQVQPGLEPLPVILDYGTYETGPKNLIGVFPGRLTLWSVVADQTLELLKQYVD